MPPKNDRLAALREARSKGGRLSQWKSSDAEIYDEVTDEQYRSIVGDRLENDDFIEDDDGSGYVDHGEDEWGGHESTRKAKRARARAKAAKAGTSLPTKAKPRASLNDYARPANTGNYRPAPANEDDFMASLLNTVTAEPSRKRKSSPPSSSFPSSDPPVPSSDSFFSSSQKRYGDDSDDDIFDPFRSSKKPRTKDMSTKLEIDADADDDDIGVDFSMDVDPDATIVKEEPPDSDEEMFIKPRAARPTAGSAARRGVQTATKHIVKPEPAEELEDIEVEVKKPAAAVVSRKPPADRQHWQAVQESLLPPKDDLETVRVPQGSTKPENVLEQDGSLRMFWLDFQEQDGVVHLIGKVLDRQSNKYVSACLSINGIQRNLFIKPRAKRMVGQTESDMDVDKTDVYTEFDSVRSKHGIDEWKCKFVQRKYAFEDHDIERGESEWMKVTYPFTQPEIPMGTTGATFSHIFGTNTTAFELLVLKRRIMGPCWLNITGAVPSTKATSWCKIEFTVDDPKNVNPFSDDDETAPKDTPPLTMMSIALRTIVNHRENKTEILVATTRTWDNVNLEDTTPPNRLPSTLSTIVRPIEKFPPGLEQRAKSERSPFQSVKAERALLNALLATIQRHDPDVIVGHNFLGNTFEALLYRLKELKADHWSRIGRFRRKGFQISKAGSNHRLLAGRLVADLSSDAAKGMITSTTWSLTEMVATHLETTREDIDPEDTHTYFDYTLDSPDKLIQFIRLAEIDTYFQLAIAARVQLLPLTKQLTNLAGNSWNLTLNGGRAVRNEFILLHEFHKLKYVCPDKTFKNTKIKFINEDGEEQEVSAGHKRGKAKYAGGLVFEPKRGLWDTYILVMDFNSLYPSIIQEYNIDFTTVEREDCEGEDEEKIPDVPSRDVAQGVLPRIIATLVQRRRQVKGLMKDKSAGAAKLQQWDIKQQALKLTANSMYGCLGFAGSRFSSRPLAALTTFKGREILTHTRELAESLSLDVVYGDTDSVFVNSNVVSYPEAVKIANEFKKLVNERYKLLEIDLDATFERVLLLNKKKYAAVKIDEAGKKSTEIKGLDMKRREFSKLSKDASSSVLKEILSGDDTEKVVEKIHEYLIQLGEIVRSGAVPLDDFIIYKNPEDYPDKKSQPHVQVALRMKAKGIAVRAHDVIPYILCLGPDGKSAKSAQADKAFHPDDLRRQGSELKIDYDLYLDSQVLQPILRLCESIEGTERSRLAECLGLDPTRYVSQTQNVHERQFFTLESQISDEERFRDAEKLSLKCPSCAVTFEFEGIEQNLKINQSGQAGVACPSCANMIPQASVALQVELLIRKYIARYYLGWTVCDGPDGCGQRTRNVSVYAKRCLGFSREGGRCKGSVRLEYSDTELYNQLLYFRHLFDGDKLLDKAKGTGRYDEVRLLVNSNQQMISSLTDEVDRFLNKNGRRFVDMRSLFGFMDNRPKRIMVG
ncbi:DNA polymerase alpha catalytic subunit [Trichosporon asahii var. asahii CBS 2479]|uniref:DNA polymerase n=1 Tax=Trichosporon asahii var. asahii (strain ATCC 90039 / CBS 2479 / JCM 2466 / KCTC 7840 / NBRC 103889/ NCYC 2677 / UAMH 7654) TaxID=1186058 RepID=J5QX16_TRIAS|nr:DNA polymerase alpha catalytic subunit [Trichosporon asahii var. asahii CBS 2479]EJT49533.1 DNA polymerase alpha catalytic subunit [Trichosporon asahii var. asahii CBS 2479]